MENNHEDFLLILPIADTVSGTQARENPQDTIDHYQYLQSQLWLSPKVRDVADGVLSRVRQGRTAWGSLSGPYGFGKTAAAISLWTHARDEGFLAIPPLSCTNFAELAHGIVALAEVQVPKMKRQIQTCFREVWTEGFDHMVRTDAKRYDVSSRKVRRIFQDKLRSGLFTVDSHPHRLVEFLAKLGQLATEFSNGLVIVLDELQQLLGPLDSIVIFI